MRIVFDRGGLRLDVDPEDPLHAEALEIWRDASALSKECMDVLPVDEADATCELLAGTATHALTAGRDDRVIIDFREVERRIRGADDALRAAATNNVFAISVISLLSGLAAGILWISISPLAPWNALPRGLDLAANYILLVLGWTGFTLVGFSIGWFFLMLGKLRMQDRASVVKQAPGLRQRKLHIAYYSSSCLIIVIVLFFFGGFEKIDENLSQQLTSAPWAILIGLVAGIVEPALSERIRGFFKLS